METRAETFCVLVYTTLRDPATRSCSPKHCTLNGAQQAKQISTFRFLCFAGFRVSQNGPNGPPYQASTQKNSIVHIQFIFVNQRHLYYQLIRKAQSEMQNAKYKHKAKRETRNANASAKCIQNETRNTKRKREVQSARRCPSRLP